jgi:Cep192 domain 4
MGFVGIRTRCHVWKGVVVRRLVGSCYGSLLVVFSMALLPSGCGGGGNGGPSAPPVLGPSLRASASSLNFGSVGTGCGESNLLTLSNNGTASLTIERATLSDPSFRVSGVSMPMLLSPAQWVQLGLAFAPSQIGTVSASLIVTDSVDTSPLTVSLLGQGIPPTAHTVEINWAESSADPAVGFNIYSGAQPGGPYTRLAAAMVTGSIFTDSLLAGRTAYYAMTATDAQGAESFFSSEVSVTAPCP